MDHKQETKEVKKALKAAGYPVISVTRGRGTAWGWITTVIDDYESKIVNGKLVSQYSEVYAIVKHAAGRDNRHDDRMTDYFCENLSVEFTRQHTCSECVFCDRDCGKYHTPEMGSCPGLFTREMADYAAAEYEKAHAPGVLEKAEAYQRECKANRLTRRIGEFARAPVGYLPHLNVTITEEAI